MFTLSLVFFVICASCPLLLCKHLEQRQLGGSPEAAGGGQQSFPSGDFHPIHQQQGSCLSDSDLPSQQKFVPPFPTSPKPVARGSSSASKPLCDTGLDPQVTNATSWSQLSRKGKATEKNPKKPQKTQEKLMPSNCPCWDVSFYILSTWIGPLRE